LAESRRTADRIKRTEPITVVIGNPPYKNNAEGRGGWIESGTGNTVVPLVEWLPPRAWRVGAHAKHLRNLYVYFWRWATWKVFGGSIITPDTPPVTPQQGVVTVAGFLNGPGFQKMRADLRRDTDEIWVIDCSPEGHQPPVASRVFQAVQQPVCIVLAIRFANCDPAMPARVRFRSLPIGRREDKFAAISAVTLDSDGWIDCPSDWRAAFLPASTREWAAFPALDEFFVYNGSGVMPGRTWVIAPDADSLRQRWDRLVHEIDSEKKELLFHPHMPRGKLGDRHVAKVPSESLHGHEPRMMSVESDKGLGRFQVRINLGEADMDSVIRKTVLRKSGPGADQVRVMLDARAGEISRQLGGSRVAHRAEDNADAVLDWPLLPSRRRVWERVLRVLDRSGMAGALRTQMAVALESARIVAGAPLGHAVPADFLYTRFADEAFAVGELPEETRARITKLREGGDAERLQARVLMLVYMLGLIQGDAEFHGVRATAEALSDVLIEDLSAGGDIRAAVPTALAALEEAGAIMPIEGVWRLQTKEAAEWDAAYRAELRGVRNNPSELASRRRAALDAALSERLKGLSAVAQGRSAVSRRLIRLGPDDKAPSDGLIVRMHNGWDETLKTVSTDIAAQPDTERVVRNAQGGQTEALKAVGHNGPPETNPVCQMIRAKLGAGRKGKELRDEFEGHPYGWPQDAVDGALLVLAHAGLIRTLGEDGKETVLRSLARQKIGLCRFLPETHTVTNTHKRAIRALGQAVGVNVPPDQEAEQLPLILKTLREAAQSAGGDPPAPAAPASPDLDTVDSLSGNERQIEAASRGTALAAAYANWVASRQTIAARLPANRTTLRLVELGAHGQQAALDDIRDLSRLLDEPDPVPPLRQDAAAELRSRLNAAFDAYQPVDEVGFG
jgi:hypothetical protein